MTARTARRKRIIRVRTVEHQMAEANLARANGELASLVELSRRLEALRADLAVARGVVAGRALNTVGELGMRLDASARRDEMGVLAQSALMKEESAVRLYERSRKSAEVEMERRADANRPHRRRTMSLRLVEGGPE